MIAFRPISLEDRATIERYTLPSESYNCDFSFANIYTWQGLYRSEWAEVKGFLVIRFALGGGDEWGYMLPLGEGDFTTLIPLLQADSEQRGEPLRLVGLTARAATRLQEVYPERFAVTTSRNTADYLYSAEQLRNLPGRGYQPKRNHINRFLAHYPNYRYQPLSGALMEECMALEGVWRQTHEGGSDALSAEACAIRRGFEAWEALGLRGCALFVGEQLVAFSYGSQLNDHTFVTHIEKADTQIEGAFAMINKLQAQHLPPHITHINREEDLGLEGLRQAKLSYQPLFLEQKYSAVALTDQQRACKQLWREAFGDEEAFIDQFLLGYYRSERMMRIEQEGELACMLHLIPFQSVSGPLCYLYGVATARKWQGKGLATRLMQEAMTRIRQEGYHAAFLIPTPGEEWLRAFYGQFGFVEERPVRFHSPDGFDFGTGNEAWDRALVWRAEQEEPLPDYLQVTYQE